MELPQIERRDKNYSHFGGSMTVSEEPSKPSKKLHLDRIAEARLDPSKEYVEKKLRKGIPHPAYNPILGNPIEPPQKMRKNLDPGESKEIPQKITPNTKHRQEVIAKYMEETKINEKSDPNAKIVYGKKQFDTSSKVVAKEIINYKDGPKYRPEEVTKFVNIGNSRENNRRQA